MEIVSVTKVGLPPTDHALTTLQVGSHPRITRAAELLHLSLMRSGWRRGVVWIVADGAVIPRIEHGWIVRISDGITKAGGGAWSSGCLLWPAKTIAVDAVPISGTIVYLDLDCLVRSDISHLCNVGKFTMTGNPTAGVINAGVFACPASDRWMLREWHKTALSIHGKSDQRVLNWMRKTRKWDMDISDRIAHHPWIERDGGKFKIMDDGDNQWREYPVLHFASKTWRWRLKSMEWYWERICASASTPSSR